MNHCGEKPNSSSEVFDSLKALPPLFSSSAPHASTPRGQHAPKETHRGPIRSHLMAHCLLELFLKDLKKKTLRNFIRKTAKYLWECYQFLTTPTEACFIDTRPWKHSRTWEMKEPGESEPPLLKELLGGSTSGFSDGPCFFEGDFLLQPLLCCLSSNSRATRVSGACPSSPHPPASFTFLHSWPMKRIGNWLESLSLGP